MNAGTAVSGLVSCLDFHSTFCPQMTGVWYEIARTRFTFNTMESVISIYEYNSDMDHLDGLFTGTLEYCSFCDLLEKNVPVSVMIGVHFSPWKSLCPEKCK